MKLEISKIKVTSRIRQQINKIEELAADIEQNSLLNPITVMPVGEGYQLLAGLRRLRAVQLLDWTEIDVNVISPRDAEAALRIEISENEQRKNFTYSERMDYAQRMEAVVRAKALERKSVGGKGGLEDVDGGPPVELGKSRDIIGSRIGMSGKQYDRARYVAEHAPPDVIDQLDSGEKTISSVYSDLRAAEKAPVLKSKKELLPENVRDPMPPPVTIELAGRARQPAAALFAFIA